MPKRGLWTSILLIVVVAALAVWIDIPSTKKVLGRTVAVHEGLDLKGGTHLVYGLDTTGVPASELAKRQQSVVEVIRRRVDAFGVSEPIIQNGQIGNTRTVLVELPGINDVNQAKDLIGKTAQLSFWEEDSTSNDASAPTGLQTGWKKTDLSGADLKNADYDITSSTSGSTATTGSQPEVKLTFTATGATKFSAITGRNIGKPVAIVLDNEILSAPTVQQQISGGDAVINGVGTLAQARQLSIELNGGALPIPIHVIEERTVGASLGSQSVQRSIIGGAIGLLMVAIFMIVLYRLAGVLAVVALVLYTLVVFALFKFIPVTLTLAGIAGFILSIGMAVDANILIFERMREERRAGKSVRTSIDQGFRRAWTSVRDSNISSLLTAAILYYFGSGLVRGFALTLAVGIIVSMFSAITVTRTLLRLALREQTTN